MKRSAHHRTTARLGLESLEPRLALAGNIVANLVGDTLYLTGDKLDNYAAITAMAGLVEVHGDGITTINGQPSLSLEVSESRLNFVVDGAKGNDELQIDIAGAGVISEVTIRGGDGHDLIEVFISSYGLNGNVSLDGGRGDDSLSLQGNLTGTASIVGGAGSDTVLCASNVGGNLLISTGDQNDRVVILFGSVGGTLTLNGGKGRDTITLPADLRADAVFSEFEDIRLL